MDCIFCKIVEGSVPSKKVFENEHVVAFHDIQPAAPVHILIIPKKHIASMNDVQQEDWHLLGEVHRAAQHIAAELGIAESGQRAGRYRDRRLDELDAVDVDHRAGRIRMAEPRPEKTPAPRSYRGIRGLKAPLCTLLQAALAPDVPSLWLS